MRLFPFVAILFGAYVLYQKHKEQPSDEVYRKVYVLAGASSIIYGCIGIIINVFFRNNAPEHGLSLFIQYIENELGPMCIAFAIVFGLIGTKLKRNSP